MGKFKQLTNEERKAIIKMKEQGDSSRKIAEIFGKTHTAINKVVKAYNEQGRTTANKRSGRPRITNKRLDKKIKIISEHNPLLSAPKIKAKLQNKGFDTPSVDTIRRRLYEDGKHGRVARKLPFVSKANLKKRMKFYNDHVLQPAEFWNRILWTDESMIRMNYSHGRIHVWRRTGEALSYKCAIPTLKSSQKGVIIWGCISSYGTGKIVILDGKVNSLVYLKLLQEIIITEGKRLIGENFVLQQDNAPIHTAKIVKEFFKRENINILEWPPLSPDLSPIENVWDLLKTRIAAKEPRNMIQLKECIKETWENITPEECRRFTLSVPNRICNMSLRNGGHSGY